MVSFALFLFLAGSGLLFCTLAAAFLPSFTMPAFYCLAMHTCHPNFLWQHMLAYTSEQWVFILFSSWPFLLFFHQEG